MPIDEYRPLTYAEAWDLPQQAAGVRFFINDPGVFGPDFDPDEELTYSTLAYCLREHMDDAGYYSPAEFWADVVVPHIVAGRILHAVWGKVSEGPPLRLRCRDCERGFPAAADDSGAICPACGADGPHTPKDAES
jgi:hypothetical protein